MSFSHDTKNELARLLPDKQCCRRAELSALVRFGGLSDGGPGCRTSFSVSTENAATARKAYRLSKLFFTVPVKVTAVNKKQFKKNKVYLVKGEAGSDGLKFMQELGICDDQGKRLEKIPSWLLRNRCCKRSYLRGAFLARGSVNKPEGEYHLEIICPSAGMARELRKLMDKMGLESRISERKSSIVLYIKESEQIVDFLRVAGASSALLDFENVRIVKSVRNQVNRLVNCETANLEKTVEASLRQTETIKRLIDKVGLQGIPAPLRNVAILRLNHPDCSLKELGGMMEPPLSKSGLAYRMRRLEALAKKILGGTN